MKLFFKFLFMCCVLFAGIIWGINTAEKGIQSIQGTARDLNVQNYKITRIDGDDVEIEVFGQTRKQEQDTVEIEGNSNWLSNVGNSMRNKVISITRASYLWVVKQL